MRGMFAKYNLEYRRPAPHNHSMLDNSSKNLMTRIDQDVFKLFMSEKYAIDRDQLRHTMVWSYSSVDWNSWGDKPSSMLVPVTSPASPTSAVGVEVYLCRSVTATNFPAFCYLLGERFTAVEIEAAWLTLQLVMPLKRNRGGNKFRQTHMMHRVGRRRQSVCTVRRGPGVEDKVYAQ